MTLYCGATGYPPPSTCQVFAPDPDMKPVTLTLNGSLGQWTNSNVTLDYGGMYSCLVYDGSATIDQKEAVVTVYGRCQIIGVGVCVCACD